MNKQIFVIILPQLSDLQKCKKSATSSQVGGAGFEPLFKCPLKASMPALRPRIHPRFNLSSGVSLMTAAQPPISPR